MPPLLDMRRSRLDLLMDEDSDHLVVITWPASMVGRTLTATLDATALDIDIAGAVVTIAVPQEAVAEAGSGSRWRLVETTGTGPKTLMGGRAMPSSGGTSSPSTSATVTIVEGVVSVTVVGQPGVGLPAGGTAGQAPVKTSSDDFDTSWVDIATQVELAAEATTRAAADTANASAAATVATNLAAEVVNRIADVDAEAADRAAGDALKVAKAGDTMTGPLVLAGDAGAALQATPLQQVQALIANLVASSPAALDTLNELAAALGNDPNFATTVTNSLAGKQPLDSDLTAIAALATTAFGRGLLALADGAALAGQVPSGTYVVPARLASGGYYGAHGVVATGSRPNGMMTTTPFRLEASTTFDRISVEVTTAGEASSLLRLGIYADNNGVPGALILDAGTVAAATTGIKAITISQLLAPGLYWLACCTQAAPTTAPVCRAFTGRVSLAPSVATNFAVGAGWGTGFAGQAGLPNPSAVSGLADIAIFVALRAA